MSSTGFKSIKHIRYQFNPHPKPEYINVCEDLDVHKDFDINVHDNLDVHEDLQGYNEPGINFVDIHDQLDFFFASGIFDIDAMYTTPERTELKPNVIDIIQSKIAEEMQDSLTDDDPRINQIVQKLAMSIRFGSGVTMLHKSTDLQHSLTQAKLLKHTQLVIYLHTDDYHFSRDFEPRGLDTWGIQIPNPRKSVPDLKFESSATNSDPKSEPMESSEQNSNLKLESSAKNSDPKSEPMDIPETKMSLALTKPKFESKTLELPETTPEPTSEPLDIPEVRSEPKLAPSKLLDKPKFNSATLGPPNASWNP